MQLACCHWPIRESSSLFVHIFLLAHEEIGKSSELHLRQPQDSLFSVQLNPQESQSEVGPSVLWDTSKAEHVLHGTIIVVLFWGPTVTQTVVMCRCSYSVSRNDKQMPILGMN